MQSEAKRGSIESYFIYLTFLSWLAISRLACWPPSNAKNYYPYEDNQNLNNP